MSLWSLTSPPTWAPDALATDDGWEMPNTPEILVAIPQLVTRNGGIRAKNGGSAQLYFDNPTYSATNGDTMNMALVFPENIILNTIQDKYWLSLGFYFLGDNNPNSSFYGPTNQLNVQDLNPMFLNMGSLPIPSDPTNVLFFSYTLGPNDIGSTIALGSPIYDPDNSGNIIYTPNLFWNWDNISQNTGPTEIPTITGVDSNINYFNLIVTNVTVPDGLPTLT